MTAGPSEESRPGAENSDLGDYRRGDVLGSWLILNTVFLILNAQTPTPWNKIQCAAGGPNFGKYETATGGSREAIPGGLATGNESTGFAASAKDEGVARTWLGDGRVGEEEGQNESSDFYPGRTSRVYSPTAWQYHNEDGTRNYDNGRMDRSDRKRHGVGRGRRRLPCQPKTFNNLNSEDRDGFDTGIIPPVAGRCQFYRRCSTEERGTINVAGNNVVGPVIAKPRTTASGLKRPGRKIRHSPIPPKPLPYQQIRHEARQWPPSNTALPTRQLKR